MPEFVTFIRECFCHYYLSKNFITHLIFTWCIFWCFFQTDWCFPYTSVRRIVLFVQLHSWTCCWTEIFSVVHKHEIEACIISKLMSWNLILLKLFAFLISHLIMYSKCTNWSWKGKVAFLLMQNFILPITDWPTGYK